MGWSQPTWELSSAHFLSGLEFKEIFIICRILWQDIPKLNPVLGLVKFPGSVFVVSWAISTSTTWFGMHAGDSCSAPRTQPALRGLNA